MDTGLARPGFSRRALRVPVPATMAVTAKARAMRAQGIKVIALSIGEPDFPTPPAAIEAAFAAAHRGETRYPPLDGMQVLKQAIQKKFQRELGLSYDLNEIIVGNGGKQIIFDALLATLNPGDEVIVPAPYWVAYTLMAELLDAVPVTVPCAQENGFRLRAEDLEAAITPRTKWLMLNYPNNPTGATMSRAEMRALADVMLRHPHVWIMSDDMYEHLLYDDDGHITMAQVEPRLRERILTVNGVSKTYAMTGWRIGYGAGPRDLIKLMANMQGQATAGVSTVGQVAAAAALDGPQDLVHERAEIYRARRDMVVERLNAIPGLRCHKPQGAFYVFPSVAGCIGKTTAAGRKIETDEDFAMALLEEQHVAAVHGAAFGMSPFIRISYATNTDALREACDRIESFCAALR